MELQRAGVRQRKKKNYKKGLQVSVSHGIIDSNKEAAPSGEGGKKNKMKVYREISLSEFDFWAGAKDRVKYLTEEELNQIEQILEEIYPEGLSEFEVNDLFWFEDELIAEWLGYEDFDEIMRRDK